VRKVIILAFFALSPFALAQSDRTSPAPLNVEVCELISHPQNYDGHIVRVRGLIVFEFEAFVLSSSACGINFSSSETKGVWLTFGGDQPEIATYCCGYPARQKGTDLEIAGHKVGLIRDANLRVFLNQISARRQRQPDGRQCYDQCKFYHVTATLTGVFAQATKDGGYGHLGMFNLLAIQQVEQVSAERTMVPFGGVYTCSEQTWEPGPDVRSTVAKSLDCADLSENDCGPEQRFRTVAAHWNDALDRGFQTAGEIDLNGDQIANWSSSDLLTSYFTRTKRDGSVSIKRERCTASWRAFAPSSTSLACEDYHLDVDEATDRAVQQLLTKDDFHAAWAKQAEGARRLYADGDQSWRTQKPKEAAWHVLLEQTRDWKVSPHPTLQFDECSDNSIEESPVFVSCNWYSPDGNEAFTVDLFKERIPGAEQKKAPWLVTQVYGEVCHSVSE